MYGTFIKEQANRFAKIINHNTKDFEILTNLQERLSKELAPYTNTNRIVFINFCQEELVKLFSDHLKRCQDSENCPQHKTSNNATFLFNQAKTSIMKIKTDAEQILTPIIDDYKNKNDLNYYFNAVNIPNQDLVFETYNYFKKANGKDFFDALDFLNLLNWHYLFLVKNVDRPFDVLNQFQSLPLSGDEKHILIGFIIKWFGGYPVNNLNTQFNTTLKLLETEYLDFTENCILKIQAINNKGLAGIAIDDTEKSELKLLNQHRDFLNKFDKVVTNSDDTKKKLKRIESQLNGNLNLIQEVKMPIHEKNILIFISHSSKDESIVKLFTDKILQLALKINLNNIFCTSIQAASITSGEDFRIAIKDNLLRASLVIQIITPNYKSSEVCLNEMGAAWVLSNKVVPFILNPVTYSSVGFIHQPNQLLKLDDINDLLKFIDETKTSDVNLKHTEVKRHAEEFVKTIREKLLVDG